ncbi:MAG: ABC transporter permease subunit [Anaerolineales bacterium]|nr:ABC transporter permease subunit [Anaerolineales bacterium]
MLQFLSRRISFIAFVCLLILFFTHFGMSMVRNSELSEPNFDVVEIGQAAWQGTRTFIEQAVNGELGTVRVDYGTVSINEILWQAYRNSMGLLLIALVVASVAGLVTGIIAAVTKNRKLVLPLLSLTLIGISVPAFFAALLLQVSEIYYYRTFGRRLVLLAGYGWDFKHLLLPVLVLAARPLAYITRAAYLSLDRIMEEDFIRTAFSKGLTLTRTVNVHGLRNIVIPILTAIGVSLRFSLGILPIVEIFFQWPGMGYYLLGAINARQTRLVVVLALALGLTFLVANLLLDLTYRLVDPRLREAE